MNDRQKELPKDSRRKLVALTKREKDTIDLVYRDLKGTFIRIKNAREYKNTIESSLEYLSKVRKELL